MLHIRFQTDKRQTKYESMTKKKVIRNLGVKMGNLSLKKVIRKFEIFFRPTKFGAKSPPIMLYPY